VITPENQEAPWLLFEAGALAKNLDRSKVCPLLFGGMEATDVKGPLVQFQAAQFSEAEMKRVIKMMNAELADSALPSDVLDNVFGMWWSGLKEDVERVLEGGDETGNEGRRSDRDLLEEVLGLTRRLASDREGRLDFEHPAWDDLFTGVLELARAVRARAPDEETAKVLRCLLAPIHHFARSGRFGRPGRVSPGWGRALMELDEMLTLDFRSKPSAEPPAEETPA
jgi:hypothetical protein